MGNTFIFILFLLQGEEEGAGEFSCVCVVKLRPQSIVFYVCREHVLGSLDLLSSRGRMWG